MTVMRKNAPKQFSGFTLIELLVVIAILATLAAIGMVVGTKMLKKGKASQIVGNMRQMAPLFSVYAAENQLKLPACNGPVMQPDGSIADMQWHEVLLTYLYPDVDPASFKTQNWWDSNSTFLRNPLFDENAKPNGFAPLNPGYGYNLMLAENYQLMSDDTGDALSVRVPTAVLDTPSRTALVATYDSYYFRFDDSELDRFKTSETLTTFLNEGKIPVLFMGGNVDLIAPREYATRGLAEIPE